MTVETAREALAGRRVMVTGAAGFIGGRLVERLRLEIGAEVRVLVRGVASASRLARFPVDFVRGDVTDPAALAAAVRDCDVVFHCAYGTSGSQRHRAWVNREGTRRLLEAAARAKVGRVVHLSTLMVYGKTPDGDLTEEAPRRRFGNAYSDSKLEAEEIALACSRAGRVPVTVLQPTAVHGPWGGVWTETVLRSLRSGRAILIENGEGIANHIYVDDLVTAMLLAAVVEGAVGEAFLASAAEPVTWRQMYGRFERMLGPPARTVSLTEAEARAYWKECQARRPWLLGELASLVKKDRAVRDRLFETRELRALRELASGVLPEAWQQRIKSRLSSHEVPATSGEGELPVLPLPPSMINFFRARTRVRIDKARRVLGFEPAWDFERSMEITEQWARWAGFLS
ncbi:MAG TPA: NAD-dependent epimerase/dehydratase family protein [Thermoanaerobaculia bacterium]|nr:NAD-dependent epimerase/dehydratase family protein [Thermoanaerobaculia bacterium]